MEHKLAVFLTKQLDKLNPRTELEQAKLQYGLEIVLDNTLKFVAMIVLGAIFGILKETLLSFVGFGILRLSAGGFHFEKNVMCWIVSMLITVGGGYLGYLRVISWQVGVFMLLISFIFVILYAPSKTKQEYDRKYARVLKIRSMVIVLVYLFIVVVCRGNSIGTVIAIGTMCEAISILPVLNRKYHMQESEIQS